MPGGYIGSILTQLYGWVQSSHWYAVLTTIESPQVRYLWAILAWIVVFLAWVPRRVTVMKVSRQKAATFAYWRRWLISHFVFLATVFFCMTPAPVYIGFWLSKPGLDRVVERRIRGRPAPAPVTQVGIYPYRDPGGRNYLASPRIVHISNLGGFVHSPDGRRPDWGLPYRFRYAGAGWYIFEQQLP